MLTKITIAGVAILGFASYGAYTYFTKPSVPSCSSSDTKDVLQKLFRANTVHFGVKSDPYDTYTPSFAVTGIRTVLSGEHKNECEAHVNVTGPHTSKPSGVNGAALATSDQINRSYAIKYETQEDDDHTHIYVRMTAATVEGDD